MIWCESLPPPNKERAKKETDGVAQWLRPDYQIHRFGSVKEKAELDLVGGKLASGPKPLFPTDDLGQNIAATTVLARVSGPLDANSLATSFKQGRRIAPKVASILAALSRTRTAGVDRYSCARDRLGMRPRRTPKLPGLP
jgi:hypothetical protein